MTTNYERTKAMSVEEMAEFSVIHIKDKDGIIHDILLDTEDLARIKDETLNIFNSKGQYRCRTGKHQYLHRLIMNAPEHLCVDHINGDTLDNRKINLRIVNHEVNMRNRKVQKNNKTKYSGIDIRNNKFRVQIGKERKHIGYFNTLKEAIKARDKEEKLQGYIKRSEAENDR